MTSDEQVYARKATSNACRKRFFFYFTIFRGFFFLLLISTRFLLFPFCRRRRRESSHRYTRFRERGAHATALLRSTRITGSDARPRIILYHITRRSSLHRPQSATTRPVKGFQHSERSSRSSCPSSSPPERKLRPRHNDRPDRMRFRPGAFDVIRSLQSHPSPF